MAKILYLCKMGIKNLLLEIYVQIVHSFSNYSKLWWPWKGDLWLVLEVAAVEETCDHVITTQKLAMLCIYDSHCHMIMWSPFATFTSRFQKPNWFFNWNVASWTEEVLGLVADISWLNISCRSTCCLQPLLWHLSGNLFTVLNVKKFISP